MKGKMLEEIKAKYRGQPIYIEFLSTKFINRYNNVIIMPDDDWGLDWLVINKNPNEEYHTHINKNRILLIRTSDQNIWKSPPEKQKWWCNNCGYKTTNPPRDYVCPKCANQPQEYRRHIMLKRLGSQKF